MHIYTCIYVYGYTYRKTIWKTIFITFVASGRKKFYQNGKEGKMKERESKPTREKENH